MESIRGIAKRYKPIIKWIPGVSRLLHAPRTVWLFVLKRMYADRYHEVVFTKIWKSNYWGDTASKSGGGSNLCQTTVIRRELTDLLGDLSVRRFLDIPCGDFHWMKETLLPPGLVYLGGDIVEEVIHQNNDRHSNSTVSFSRLNILLDQLPKVDLVLCRDCLVHFNTSDVFKALYNLKRSGSTYLLVTHFDGARENCDIITGEWRPINLMKSPFNFPPPLRVINEDCTEYNWQFQDKCLALWRLEDVPGSSRE